MKLLLVDDHELFLDGLKLLFASNNQQDEILVAKSSLQALELLKSTSIDFMLVDINMPNMNGIELLQACESQALLVPFAVISAEQNASKINQAAELGASGFISKSSSGNELMQAVEKMLAGEILLPQLPSNTLEMTERQLVIVKAMADGLSNKEIGMELGISIETVKSHVKVIYKKLGASNRASCINNAINLGLI